jgi:hypothetical protein
MSSVFSLFRTLPPQKGSGIVPPDATSVKFTGRIDRRLSVVFVSLFILVLVVGGTSFYLLRSHLLKSDVIARQSEQIELVEQIESRTVFHRRNTASPTARQSDSGFFN